MAAMDTPKPVRIYVIYAHEDSHWVKEGRGTSGWPLIGWLQEHLAAENVEITSDQDLQPGDRWMQWIEQRLASADIVLVLMTRGLLNSMFIKERELPLVVDRARAGELRAIPVLVEPGDWQSDASGIGLLSFANSDPLTDTVDDDDKLFTAFWAILARVREVIRRLREDRSRAVSLVVSYCEEDERWVDEDAATSLVQLIDRGLTAERVDVSVVPPAPVVGASTGSGLLGAADIVVLVVSQDYLYSPTYATLRTHLRDRARGRGPRLLPIVVRRALMATDELLASQQCLFADNPLVDRSTDPRQWSEAQDLIVSAIRALVVEAREALPTSDHLIFVSAKSEDNDAAAQVYAFLTGHGLKAFFSRESLPALGDADYRRRIDQAIDEAAHMVVVTSSHERVMSRWVEREWGLFDNELSSGRKTGNLLSVIAGDMTIAELPLTLRGKEVVPLTDEGLERLLAFVKDPPRPA